MYASQIARRRSPGLQINRPLRPFEILELFIKEYLKVQIIEIEAHGFHLTGFWKQQQVLFVNEKHLSDWERKPAVVKKIPPYLEKEIMTELVQNLTEQVNVSKMGSISKVPKLLLYSYLLYKFLFCKWLLFGY